MDIERRIQKAEQKLNINRQTKPRVLVFTLSTDNPKSSLLPENVEEWITYKETLRDYPDIDVVILFSSQELAARELVDLADKNAVVEDDHLDNSEQKQPKSTKNNQSEKNKDKV